MTERGRQKARGHMAHAAILVGRHVIGRRRFAGGGDAVVTGCTVIHDTGVIESGPDECCGHMTNGAVFHCRQMGKCFTGCGHAVVARGAVIDDARMIEYRRFEGTTGNMTDTAVIRRRHVRRIGLRILAGRIGAVVTGVAAKLRYLGTAVINKGIEEIRRVMTGRTVTAGIVMKGGIRLAPGTDRHMVRAAVMA